MGPFIVLDIETTGRQPDKDHIIEVAAIKWQDFQVVSRFESLLNPKIKIPYEIELLTGINDKMLETAPALHEVKGELREFIGDMPIIGHNIGFDTSFLRLHLDELKNPEIDTLVLAKILLMKEGSYALEVLMKKYGLPARGSHRAMADVETTVDFFEFLLWKIGGIDRKVFASIKDALQKTDWHGKVVFDEVLTGNATKSSAGDNIKVSADKKDPSTSPSLPSWNDSTVLNLKKDDKILLESNGEIPFGEFKDERLVIAYESFGKRNDIQTAARGKGLDVALLKEPSFYLSSKKLFAKLKSAALPAAEVPFLLKLILWNSTTETGDREEISLEREEYGVFENLCDEEGDDVYWGKAIKKADSSNVVLVHHYGLARGLTKKLSGRLIVLEAARLEDSFTNAYRKRVTEAGLRSFFGEKAALAMGMIGIVYDHFVSPDDGGFSGNVILNDEVRGSKQWKQAIAAFENLPDCPKKTSILETLSPAENRIQWISSFADEISLNDVPVNLGPLFSENTANFSQTVMQDPSLSADGTFTLIHENFELDSTWVELKEKSDPKTQLLGLKLHSDFPSPYSSGYFKKCVGLFSEIIDTNKGKSLFLMSSKKAVEAMYSALLPHAEAAGVKLLGVGPSGGVGKSLAIFLNKPAGSVLISTNQILPYIQDIEQHIDTIVFQKIPFDPPSDPLLSARAARFENGFEQYSLPRAIMRFREILNILGRGSKKTCHLLDSRLLSRDYGLKFISPSS